MNRLRFLRTEKNLLQEDIGRVIGVSGRAIGNYETEKRKMSPDKIIKLANFFNVSVDYLLGKSDIRNPEKIDANKTDVAFSSGFNGLNETNKSIIQNTIEGLLAKQKLDEGKKR